MNRVIYTFGSEGNSMFIRAAADAMEGTLGTYYEGEGWQQDSSFVRRVPHLQQDESVRAVGVEFRVIMS